MQMSRIVPLEIGWNSPRWIGVTRAYQAKDLERLRGTARVEHSLARAGSEKLWRLLHREEYVPALSALTVDQALEMARAGLKAIYLSGPQLPAQTRLDGQISPELSVHPGKNDAVRSINDALMRAAKAAHADSDDSTDWMLPIVADAEAGFGGVLNAFERTKSMIEAGAAAVCFEDQLSSARKCGHMGGNVLAPTRKAIHKLIAARLAADILDVPTILIAATCASGAELMSSDCGPEDTDFLTGERSREGFLAVRSGTDAAIARGLAYAPYADMLWCETCEPNLGEARKFAKAIHAEFPGKLLAYNCSPSFHWQSTMNEWEISQLQRQLAAAGYRFQLVTPAGFQAANLTQPEFAGAYAGSGHASQFATA
jgi:isocitrate lyase